MIVLGTLFIRHGISKRISIVDYCAIVHCRDPPTTKLLEPFLDDNEKESHRRIKANGKRKHVEVEKNFFLPSNMCDTIYNLNSTL